MNIAYALIHKANWPLDGESRLSCFPNREMAEAAAKQLVEDGQRQGAQLFRIALSDLIILEVKRAK